MKRFIVVFCLLVLPIHCLAQLRLTMDECIELALSNNKRIRASSLQIDAAHLDTKSALSNYLPTLTLAGNTLYSTARGTLSVEGGMLPVIGADGIPTGIGVYMPDIDLGYNVDWIYGAGVQLRQPIYMGGRVIAAHKIARLKESMAYQNLRLAKSDVIFATAQAYANVVRASEMCKVATAYNELLVELSRSVEQAVARGVKSRNDMLRVEVKLKESELNVQRATNAQRLATMNLCHYIGYPLTTHIELSSDILVYDQNRTSTDILMRPEAQLLMQKSEMMHQLSNVTKAEILPRVALLGHYGYTGGLHINGEKLLDGWNFTAGVQLSIPIFSLGAHSKYRSARILYKQSQVELSEQLELITLEATQAEYSLDEAAYELQLAEAGRVSATENLRVSGSMYAVGRLPLTDYLEAQAIWMQAEQTLVDAKVNQFLRLLEYRKKSGTLDNLP